MVETVPFSHKTNDTISGNKKNKGNNKKHGIVTRRKYMDTYLFLLMKGSKTSILLLDIIFTNTYNL